MTLLKLILVVFVLKVGLILASVESEDELDSSLVISPLVIQTKTGLIRGSTLLANNGKQVDAWYGIPFAKPPTGDLRFKHPLPAESWHGVRDTTSHPSACYQIDGFSTSTLSEDCLYLNVVVPRPRPSQAAVMVWIHGGAFLIGSSTEERTDYKTLASEQNVIVVSIQYRLGSFGFLYMDSQDTTGNARYIPENADDILENAGNTVENAGYTIENVGDTLGNARDGPGNAGDTLGNSEDTPGNSGHANGNEGDTLENAGHYLKNAADTIRNTRDTPVNAEDTIGNAGDAPGNAGVTIGNERDTLENAGDAPGNSGDAPGNAGLFDQALALQWVVDNIEQFGGDSENVTIFGASAGAASIGMHLISPISKNLFSRAIMECGSPLSPNKIKSKEEMLTIGLSFAQEVGCAISNPVSRPPTDSTATIDCLRQLDAPALVASESRWRDRNSRLMQSFFVPMVDGNFLEKHPREMDNKTMERVKNNSILIGSNRDEGFLFFATFPNLPVFQNSTFLEHYSKDPNIPKKTFRTIVEDIYPTKSNVTKLAILHEYTPWTNQEDTSSNLNALEKMVGDEHVTCPVNEFAYRYLEQDDHRNQIYKYHFTHRSSKSSLPGWNYSLHVDEVQFVFGDPLTLNNGDAYSADEKVLSSRMMSYWANFARTGNPNLNPDGSLTEIEWPMLSKQTQQYLILETGTKTIGTHLRAKQCAFWGSFLPELARASAGRVNCGPAI